MRNLVHNMQTNLPMTIVSLFTIFLPSVTGRASHCSLDIRVHRMTRLGQTTEAPNYSCAATDATFSLSSSSHSAWQPTSNCTLQQFNVTFTNNGNCRSSPMPCFDYRTVDNGSFWAPAFACSVLPACDPVTRRCASDSSVCVVNSCCSSQTVCLPIVARSFCRIGKDRFSFASRFR